MAGAESSADGSNCFTEYMSGSGGAGTVAAARPPAAGAVAAFKMLGVVRGGGCGICDEMFYGQKTLNVKLTDIYIYIYT